MSKLILLESECQIIGKISHRRATIHFGLSIFLVKQEWYDLNLEQGLHLFYWETELRWYSGYLALLFLFR